jgi:hypothetical protein
MKTISFVVFTLIILCLVFKERKTVKGAIIGRKLAEQVASHSVVFGISVAVDDLLWPVVMLWQGALVGGIIMFAVVLMVNLIMIWAYDKIKKDILAFDDLRELTEQEHKGICKRWLAKFIKVNKISAFIAISFYDPFLSVIYMRKEIEKYTMNLRDWGYFLIAMAISCVGWTLCWQVVIMVIKTIVIK